MNHHLTFLLSLVFLLPLSGAVGGRRGERNCTIGWKVAGLIMSSLVVIDTTRFRSQEDPADHSGLTFWPLHA